MEFKNYLKSKNTHMETLGKICFTIIATIINTIIVGFVFTLLWKWFIVPTFHSNQLSLIQAIGLSFFIGYVIRDPYKKEDHEEPLMNRVFRIFVTTILYSVMIILMGILIKLFY